MARESERGAGSLDHRPQGGAQVRLTSGGPPIPVPDAPRGPAALNKTSRYRFFLSFPIVILNPSGSDNEKSRVPQGWSCGSASSVPPFALIFAASLSTS